MLVLSRKEGEKIYIEDNIVLTITQLKGNRVVVGIEASRNIAIRRGELAFDGIDFPSPEVVCEAIAARVA